ncbi:MAG: AAA family ATPase [Holophagales bacterium]|nr:AAA family ATPase [Holophagales bacterium]MYG29246.1 AAA family ATPase [Holophagales bacterium]MYI81184.1 AAA family ATPase [Holophagales bacterium]
MTGRAERPLADEAARKRIREALKESQLVEAAAGTGKTTVLVERLVAILEQGLGRVDGLAAVTFTRKAAGELKLRLREELDKRLVELRAAGVADRRTRNLEAAISRLEEASIGTIHSLCAEILRERPVEAGVDPGFGELAEDEAPRLFNRAFRSWIEEQLESMPPGLRRELARLTAGPWSSRQPALDRLRDTAWRLVEWRDFPSSWQRPDFDRGEELVDLAARVERLADLLRHGRRADILRRGLDRVAELAAWIARSRELGASGPTCGDEETDGGEAVQDQLEARLVELQRRLRGYGAPRKGRGGFAEGVARDQVWKLWQRLAERLEEFVEVADADLAALLRDELAGAVERYEEAKSSLGKLDFHDLLIKARDLLRSDRTVRAHLQQRYGHLFIDEFQDTDPLQAEILLLLAAESPEQDDWTEVRPAAGKLFVVGDPKQSIYRFRRADVVLYHDVREMLADRGVEVLHLTTSFRSVAPIQRVVNMAFEPLMTGDHDAGSADYIVLGEHREPIPGQPGVIALPPPRPYGRRNLSNREIEACQPYATVEFVRWLIEDSNFEVEVPDPDRPGHRMRSRIRPRDVCLLFRRFLSWNRDTSREYVRGLEAVGVPHLLLGARSFHEREEVEALRSALKAVEWPDDDLSVYATLRGGLFAFDDELLLLFKARYGTWHPLQGPRRAREDGEPPEEFRSVVEVLDFLAELHRRRNYRPIVRTVQEVLARPRAQASMALRPAGNQVLGNAQRVCDLARRYELAGGRSFRGFVEQLDEEAERPASTQAPVVEEDAEGVRIMTVHTAKGLEFPVVILADMTAGLSRGAERTVRPEDGLCAMRLLGLSPQELLDAKEIEDRREEAEGVRVAYVAATRARDLLVVPAVGDAQRKGWVQCLNEAVYPPAGQWRQSEPAEGCPAFGERTVARRPHDYENQPETSVRPGRHSFPGVAGEGGDTGYDVVWWDAELLDEEPPASYGLLGEDLLVEAGDDANRERFERWRRHGEELVARSSEPSVSPVAVTELECEPPGEPVDVAIEELARSGRRPGGKRFGSLVHTVLRDASLSGEASRISELARLHGALIGSTAAEVTAAEAAVTAALASPAAEAARTSQRVLRETPFLLLLDGEEEHRIVEGAIDLAYLDDDGRWIVVDWKTDLGDLDAPAGVSGDDGVTRGERYRRQVRWYCHALEQLTGTPASGRLVLL